MLWREYFEHSHTPKRALDVACWLGSITLSTKIDASVPTAKQAARE
uniref:Uncharacterized protein n=1 Tax=Rhizobium rhizogenes TaxID=359 RepID=A0A7S5DQQ4_RHIRH|nr:hypothetical protein pC5.8a_26 [Rhizobium rhizogenes]